ncbi:hypothetical protein Q9L28_25445, partial (plasmid) [Escherichia coli]
MTDVSINETEQKTPDVNARTSQASDNTRKVVQSKNEPRQPGGCKLKTAPVRPVVAARPAE